MSNQVRAYIPRPLQCKRCFGLWHVTTVCKRELSRCGEDGCSPGWSEQRKEGAKCFQCDGVHEADSTQCPLKKREVEVIKVKTIEKVTYCMLTQLGR